MRILERLPEHPVPGDACAAANRNGLQVVGLVERPGPVGASVLTSLPRAGHDGEFACEEGWMVPGLCWQGMRLADVIATAGPLPGARYVRIESDDYVLPLPMDAAMDALLADTLNGEPLTLEHGAPWRLLLPGGQCFTSVKWVDRIELSAAPGDNTAEAVARARLNPA